MTPLDRVIRFLKEHGLRAERRQWQLGDSVLATPLRGETSEDGIEVFAAVLYIVSVNGAWQVVDYSRSGHAQVTEYASVWDACALVVTRLGRPPDLLALVDCARRLSSAMGFTSPPDEVLRDTIESVLIRRHATQNEISGLLTRIEAIDLLLAHLQTLIYHHAGVSEQGLPVAADIAETLEVAWFGASSQGAP